MPIRADAVAGEGVTPDPIDAVTVPAIDVRQLVGIAEVHARLEYAFHCIREHRQHELLLMAEVDKALRALTAGGRP
jgi:hypothetical protein